MNNLRYLHYIKTGSQVYLGPDDISSRVTALLFYIHAIFLLKLRSLESVSVY